MYLRRNPAMSDGSQVTGNIFRGKNIKSSLLYITEGHFEVDQEANILYIDRLCDV